MTKNQKTVLRYQKQAQKEIKRLENLGWKVSERTKERAIQPLKERYTKRQMEALHDLLSVSHIRSQAEPIEVTFTARRSAFKYKRDENNNIVKSESGVKQLDMKKVTPVKTFEKTVRITPQNAGSLIHDTMKRAMTSHPSREAADIVYKFLADIEKTTGETIFPDIEYGEIRKEIMKYVPDKKELNRLIEKQALSLPEQIRRQQVAYKQIATLIQDISRLTGTTEQEYAAKMRKAYDNAARTMGKTHQYMKQTSIEKIIDFFEYSGSDWQKYRKKHDSDDFVRQFDEMLTIYDDHYEEPDWEYLNVQLERDEPVSKIFNNMREMLKER